MHNKSNIQNIKRNNCKRGGKVIPTELPSIFQTSQLTPLQLVWFIIANMDIFEKEKFNKFIKELKNYVNIIISESESESDDDTFLLYGETSLLLNPPNTLKAKSIYDFSIFNRKWQQIFHIIHAYDTDDISRFNNLLEEYFDNNGQYKATNVGIQNENSMSLIRHFNAYRNKLSTLQNASSLKGKYVVFFNGLFEPNLVQPSHQSYFAEISCFEMNPLFLSDLFTNISKNSNGDIEIVFILPKLDKNVNSEYTQQISESTDEVLDNLPDNGKYLIIDYSDTSQEKVEKNKVYITINKPNTYSLQALKNVLEDAYMSKIVSDFFHDTRTDIGNYVQNSEYANMSEMIQPKNLKNVNSLSKNSKGERGNSFASNDLFFDLYVFRLFPDFHRVYQSNDIYKRVQTIKYDMPEAKNQRTKKILQFLINPYWDLDKKIMQILELAKKHKRCLMIIENAQPNSPKIDVWNIKSKLILLTLEKTFNFSKLSLDSEVSFSVYVRDIPKMFARNRYFEDVVNFDTIADYIRAESTIDFKFEKKVSTSENKDDWWMSYYFDPLRICKKGRLLQTYGTCWFNVYLNMIILNMDLRNELHYTWLKISNKPEEMKRLCPNTSDDKCLDYNVCPSSFVNETNYIQSLRDMLLRLYANIFIYNYKMFTPQNHQTLLKLSVKIRQHNKVNEANVNIPFNDINKAIQSNQELDRAMINQLRPFYVTTEVLFDLLSSVIENKSKISHYRLHNNYDKYKMPWYIIIGYPLTQNYDNKNYSLMSCYIELLDKDSDNLVKKGHGVTGFCCGNTYFVYDSNDQEPFECEWHTEIGLQNILKQNKYKIFNNISIPVGILVLNENLRKTWTNTSNVLPPQGGKSRKQSTVDKVSMKGYKRHFVVHKTSDDKKYVKVNGEIKLLSSIRGKYTKVKA